MARRFRRYRRPAAGPGILAQVINAATPPVAPVRPFAEWQRLVRGSTAGLTPEQVDAVATLCVEHPDWGVWHALAQYSGRDCWCAQCMPNARFC